MAQQKLIVALCLFGVVACVSGQQFNAQSCSDSVRREAQKYQESLTTSAQKFTQSLQQQGASAMDTSQFQGEVDKLTQSLSSMADVSQGVDPSHLMSQYLENIQTVSNIMRQSMRLSLFSGAMREYFSFGSEMYTAYTGFLQQVTESCMPANKRLVLP